MQQGSRIVLNRQQLRQTILIDKLNQLWNENKLIYVLMLIGMFAIAIVTILYVLEIVVVPSKKVEAARFRRYILLRKYQSSLLNGQKIPPPNAGNETVAVAGGGTVGVASSQHQSPQHQKPQHQNEASQHQLQNNNHQSQRHKHNQNHHQHSHQHQQHQHQHQKQHQKGN